MKNNWKSVIEKHYWNFMGLYDCWYLHMKATEPKNYYVFWQYLDPNCYPLNRL